MLGGKYSNPPKATKDAQGNATAVNVKTLFPLYATTIAKLKQAGGGGRTDGVGTAPVTEAKLDVYDM